MHRFYIGETKDKSGQLELTEMLWINDAKLANQILRVLRMRLGEELILFDGRGGEVLYRIIETEQNAVHLHRVTEITPKEPLRKIVLGWSLLKKDKNEWVLQKCTELGVTHFLPLITDRTEKTGFDIERARKIMIEAAEQCGRHTIPEVNEPQSLRDVIGQHKDHMKICVADMDGTVFEDDGSSEVIILIGPEGGWSDEEKAYFTSQKLPHISISYFTLRAETACIGAVSLFGTKNG